MTPDAVLAWLERNASQLVIQEVSPKVRLWKNRVLLSYRDAGGETRACGGPTIRAAVERAYLRNQVLRRRSVLSADCCSLGQGQALPQEEDR